MTYCYSEFGGEREMHELLEWDWTLRPGQGTLHHVATIEYPDPRGCVAVVGVTSCGRRGTWHIPGIAERLDGWRCLACCRKLGIPRGIGSPKNDDALRPWVEARLAARTTPDSEKPAESGPEGEPAT